MNKGLVVLVSFSVLFCLRQAAWGQELRLLDIPGSGRPPGLAPNLPVSPEVRSALQKALEGRDFVSAETILVKEIDRNPKSTELLTFAGSVFFLDGKYLNSAIALKKAEEVAPLDDRSRFTLAMAYITLNHRDWARPELEQLAHSDRRDALYPYWLSRLDYDAMNFESAVRHAQKALDLNPKFMKAYDELGLCYEALGKFEPAIQAYRNAARLNERDLPCSPWPPHDLGALLIKLDRLNEAEESLKQSLQCDPRFPRGHYQMGFLLGKQKKNDRAVEELKEAAALDPSYAEPYYLLGQIYQRKGDQQEAAEAWATFEKLKKAESRERPH